MTTVDNAWFILNGRSAHKSVTRCNKLILVTQYNSAVMIDTAMQPWDDSEFSKWRPIQDIGPINPHYSDCSCSSCQDNQSGASQTLLTNCDYLRIDATLTDEQYLICDFWVFGYILNARRWGLLWRLKLNSQGLNFI